MATGEFIVYGARGSGSVAVEAALTLAGAPYRVVEASSWGDAGERAAIATKNPLGQIPALELSSGELMTESAAMLVWIADTFPEAGLAPRPEGPGRAAFLRRARDGLGVAAMAPSVRHSPDSSPASGGAATTQSPLKVA